MPQRAFGNSAAACKEGLPSARRESKMDHHLDCELQQSCHPVTSHRDLHINETGNVPTIGLVVEKELVGMTITVCEARWLPCGSQFLLRPHEARG
jgi:hypothetical protein